MPPQNRGPRDFSRQALLENRYLQLAAILTAIFIAIYAERRRDVAPPAVAVQTEKTATEPVKTPAVERGSKERARATPLPAAAPALDGRQVQQTTSVVLSHIAKWAEAEFFIAGVSVPIGDRTLRFTTLELPVGSHRLEARVGDVRCTALVTVPEGARTVVFSCE